MKFSITVFSLCLMVTLTSYAHDMTPTHAGYAGEDLSPLASIARSDSTKGLVFESRLTGAWQLYYGASVASVSFSKPLLVGTGAGSFPLDVPKNQRGYFQLVTPGGSAILAERHLPMAGGFNFRDLGGYKTKDNRYVQWGKIIRSDDLGTLTEADLNYLSALPLINIVDFRSTEEIKAAPDKIPASAHGSRAYSISPGNLAEMMETVKNLNSEGIDRLMEQMNELFVSDPVAIEQYRKMFKLLQEPTGSTPLLYHCTAGKDRTGMASALILFALGVDEATVMNDYLLSNRYILRKFATEIQADPQLRGLYSVKASYLQAGLNRIKRDHGSVEDFLTHQLDADIEQLRKLYLY